MSASFTALGAVAALKTPYKPELVAALKARIPSWARAWDAARRAWLIDPLFAAQVVDVCREFGFDVTAPTLASTQRLRAEVWYLARPKGDAPYRVAHGMDKYSAWRYVIDESALRRWFGVDNAQAARTQTLYAVVGVAHNADEETIKRAVKRALLQWHPDRCREPDAAERTRLIIEARDTLLNPRLRARYDAGLRAEDLSSARSRTADDWTPPLRSGILIGRGYEIGDKMRIVTIDAWDDIIDAAGRTLVAGWRAGDERPSFTWV